MIGAIVACRMTSSRLPGKTLLVVQGKSLLGLLIERLRQSQTLEKIVVATTNEVEDNPIEEACSLLKIPCYRGSLDNVLERFVGAAEENDIDVAVRVTGDCPLIDPEVVDQVVNNFLSEVSDYTSNVLERSFPRGLDAEVVKVAVLKEILDNNPSEQEKEHVTFGVYNNKGKYVCHNVLPSKELNRPELRLCVDTKDDFKLVSNIYDALYQNNSEFRTKDVIQLLDDNKQWLEINSHVEQKKVT